MVQTKPLVHECKIPEDQINNLLNARTARQQREDSLLFMPENARTLAGFHKPTVIRPRNNFTDGYTHKH